MKKAFFLLFASIYFLGCTSDEQTSKQEPNQANFVELNGEKYYFDKLKITRADTGDSYSVYLYSTPLDKGLYFNLRYIISNSVPAGTYHDLNSGTYTYGASNNWISSASLLKYTSNITYNVISNESDFIGKSSRVIVQKNSETNYTFNINFVTTLGSINGIYTGEAEKIGF